ncbi:MAG TPA: dihydrofolate reductase family protein [Acidimicrobiales bacterium]|nr:dihydrofolate reductase family protein [Acidimicrobiales bacterium]
MGELVYAAITSLDLFVEDESGGFGWAEPDDEVHAFVNDLERGATTYLYGRRMYETMAGWETMDTGPDQRPAMREFAEIWRAADKVVYSSTLDRPTTARTRVVRTFDPDEVRDLKQASAGDLSIGGATVAANAFRAGLVDQVHLFLHPILVGGGKPALPAGVQAGLELVDERRFAGGVVYLRYRVRPESGSTPPGGA